MSKEKFGRNGDTLVMDLGNGEKVSFVNTHGGLRANLHRSDGTTESVDPINYGVAGMHGSTVGGNHRRLTLKTPDGQSIDKTIRGDGSIDECIHNGDTTYKKK